MKGFYTGVFVGFVLKNQFLNAGKIIISNFLNAFHSIKKKKQIEQTIGLINSIKFVCNITDINCFNELFPDRHNCNKVQPYWEYCPNKQTVTINMDHDLVGYLNNYENINISFFDIFNFHNNSLTTLDLAFFEKFGKCYIYINYNVDNKDFINIYKGGSIISHEDFVLKDTPLSRKYSNLICATAILSNKNEYITKYFKMFLNNASLTPREIFMIYDKVKNLEYKLSLVKANSIDNYSIDELI